MNSFKDFIADDIATTFINTDEFAEICEFMGVEMEVVESISESDSAKLGKKLELLLDGVFTSFKRISFAKTEITKNRLHLPDEGDLISYNHVVYQVANCTDNAGLVTVDLILNSDGV